MVALFRVNGTVFVCSGIVYFWCIPEIRMLENMTFETESLNVVWPVHLKLDESAFSKSK